jgi:hypothetical protein
MGEDSKPAALASSREALENVPVSVQIRSKTSLNKLFKSTNTLDELDTESKISSLSEVAPADHIVISVDAKKYCHAIVDSVDVEKDVVAVIYFDDTETQCSLDAYMLNEMCVRFDECKTSTDKQRIDCRKHGVKKSSLLIDLTQVEIYTIRYEEPIVSAEKTLEKANKYVGHEKYNVFINNDEHFAIYCKTGKAAKLFIIDPKEISATKIIGKSLPDKVCTQYLI